MSSFHKILALSVVALALLIGSGLSLDEASPASCNCAASAQLDTSLPMSHPVNRCASEQQDVNWWSWLGGHATDGQFHFLDLLELLSRMSGDQQPATGP